jgi:hypothetical protein
VNYDYNSAINYASKTTSNPIKFVSLMVKFNNLYLYIYTLINYECNNLMLTFFVPRMNEIVVQMNEFSTEAEVI